MGYYGVVYPTIIGCLEGLLNVGNRAFSRINRCLTWSLIWVIEFSRDFKVFESFFGLILLHFLATIKCTEGLLDWRCWILTSSLESFQFGVKFHLFTIVACLGFFAQCPIGIWPQSVLVLENLYYY